MSVAVNPPMTPVTSGSNGIAAATIPNVCKMPGPPAPFVPTPLPNIGRSGLSPKKYSKKVKVKGKKVAIKGATFKSMGDMTSKATGGGIISAQTHGVTKFVGPGSMDVKFEGKNVHLHSDPMLNNCGKDGIPANSATAMGVRVDIMYVEGDGDLNCEHVNMTRSAPEKIQRRKSMLEMKESKCRSRSKKRLNDALRYEKKGRFDKLEVALDKAIADEDKALAARFEIDVATETNAIDQSVEYDCPDCGMHGEFDCITRDGTIKEVKIRGKAAKHGQFLKHRSAAKRLFPGQPVHIAVPAGERKNVTSSIPSEDIQEHPS